MEVHSYMRSSNFKFLAATVALLIASRAHAQNSDEGPQVRAGHIHLEQGRKVHVKVGYGQGNAGPVKAQLICSKYVVQLYLSFPDVLGAPLRALRGFKRVHLKSGESKNVRFELKDRDLSMVTEAGEPIIAEGKYSLSIGGGQPATAAPTVSGTFQVKGRKTLLE